MNKLSELSKPAWIVGEKEIADFMSGDEALLVRGHDPESTEPALRMYSQEYVSALLAELEAKDKTLELEREKSRRVMSENHKQEERIAELERSLTDSGRERDDWVEHSSKMERRAIETERKLATPVRLPEGLAQKIKVTGYYEALNEMMDCVRAAGFKCVGDGE